LQPGAGGGLFDEEIIEEHGDQAFLTGSVEKPRECYVKKKPVVFPLAWCVKPWEG